MEVTNLPELENSLGITFRRSLNCSVEPEPSHPKILNVCINLEPCADNLAWGYGKPNQRCILRRLRVSRRDEMVIY